jgi:hypothetical protein
MLKVSTAWRFKSRFCQLQQLAQPGAFDSIYVMTIQEQKINKCPCERLMLRRIEFPNGEA